MMLACHALMFEKAMLHGVVVALDRYYAARRYAPVGEGELMRLALAAICTEMKIANSDHFPPGYWQRILGHLSQGQVTLKSILSTEVMMLKQLKYVVGVPNPLTFLR